MPEEQEQTEETRRGPNMATYVAENAPSFFMTLDVAKDKRYKIRFENKVLHLNLDNEYEREISERLDKLIAEKPAISRIIKKVDIVAAEEAALAHRRAFQEAAIKGPMTSAHNPALRAQMEAQARQLERMGADPEETQRQLDEMKADLTITAPTKEVVRDSGEGFVADKPPVNEADKNKIKQSVKLPDKK